MDILIPTLCHYRKCKTTCDKKLISGYHGQEERLTTKGHWINFAEVALLYVCGDRYSTFACVKKHTTSEVVYLDHYCTLK